MAIHTTTSIFGEAFKLLGAVVEATRNMPRNIKPILGKDLYERTVQVTTLIARANRANDKAPYLLQLTERTDEIEALLRLSVESGYIDRKRYGAAILHTQSVGKQATRWRQSSSNTPVPRTSRHSGQSDSQPGRAAGPQGHRHAR